MRKKQQVHLCPRGYDALLKEKHTKKTPLKRTHFSQQPQQSATAPLKPNPHVRQMDRRDARPPNRNYTGDQPRGANLKSVFVVTQVTRARRTVIWPERADRAGRVIDRLLTQLESAARCCLMRDAALVKEGKKRGRGGAVKDEQANNRDGAPVQMCVKEEMRAIDCENVLFVCSRNKCEKSKRSP